MRIFTLLMIYLFMGVYFSKAHDLTTSSQSTSLPTTKELNATTAKLTAGLKAYDTIFSVCDSDISFHHSNTSNLCYYYAETGNINWAGVKALCEEKDAHLATPSTLEKLEDLIAFMQWKHSSMYEMNVWLGLFYPEESGVPVSSDSINQVNWIWVDGTPYSQEVSQWKHGEPAVGDKWVIQNQGKWFATPRASDADFFVCEKEKLVSSSTRLPLTSYPTPEGQLTKTGQDKTKEGRTNLNLLALVTLIVPILTIIILIVLIKKGILQINRSVADLELVRNGGYGRSNSQSSGI